MAVVCEEGEQDMAQRAGRVTCPKCGANNFDTVTSCWKCGTPMGSGVTAMAAAPISPPAPAPSNYVERAPQLSQAPGYAPVAPAAVPTGDSGVARRAAIALALTIPWVGLPAGWIFMMIEDRRKQAIGRVCVAWSVVGLIAHLAVMTWMTSVTVSFCQTYVMPFLQGYLKGMQSRGGAGSGMEGGGGLGLP